MPNQMWGPPSHGGVDDKISPERPEPQPMSRIKDGEGRERSSRARLVISTCTFRTREDVVYLRDSESL